MLAQKLAETLKGFCDKKFFKDQEAFFKKREKLRTDYEEECHSRVEGMSPKHPQRVQILKSLGDHLERDMKNMESGAKELLKRGKKMVEKEMKPSDKKELVKFWEKHMLKKYADQQTAMNRLEDYDLN